MPTSCTTGRLCKPEIPAVAADVDTFLVTVYCLIDDQYRAHAAPIRAHLPGRPGRLSDSEVLTLAVIAQWQPNASERQFVAWAVKHWRTPYFPNLISQSAFNRRVRQLCGVLAKLSEWIRQAVEALLPYAPVYQVVDGVAVPLMRRGRGRRHRCFGDEADVGRGGSDHDWYYGVKMLAAVDNVGFLTGWVVGPASTEEHWLAEALFRWQWWPDVKAPTADSLATVLGPSHRHGGVRFGPRGPVRGRLSAGRPFPGSTLSDLGLQGDAWRQHWFRDLGARVLLKTDYAPGSEQRRSVRWFSRRRLQIEATFSTLEAAFHLKFPRARTFWGLLTRLAAKASAYNLALAVNLLAGSSTRAFFNPLA